MAPIITIRHYKDCDAEEVSALITENLLQVNARDYGQAAVLQMARFYTPPWINEFAKNGEVLVAVEGDSIIGTAALDQERVRNVFVRIDRHGQGVGKLLMQAVEDAARKQGQPRLCLEASLYAVRFYEKLGYLRQKELVEQIGEAQMRVVLMEKKI